MSQTHKPRLFYIDGKTYDFANFAKIHPGGEEMLIFEGIDCSIHYRMLHFKSFDHEKMQKYLLKDIPAAQFDGETTQISEFGQAIIDAVRKELGKKNFYANYIYYVKSLIIMFLCLAVEYFYITNGHIIFSLLLGFLFSQLGMNVQHDATHGAMGEHRWWHGLFKWIPDWFGGSRILWMQQHVVSHHPYTNDLDKDNDISSGDPIMIFHPLSKNFTWIHRFQHLYYQALLCFYVISHVFNFKIIWNMQHTPIVKKTEYASSKKNKTVGMRILYLIRLIALPYLIGKLSISTIILNLFILQLVQGFILGMLFLISHNFEQSLKENFSKDWFKNQVESSSTYGGFLPWLLTGGLNYQIEHHLFPKMSHVYYPRIQKPIMEVCKQFNVKYTYYPSLFDNIWSTIKHLQKIAQNHAKYS